MIGCGTVSTRYYYYIAILYSLLFRRQVFGDCGQIALQPGGVQTNRFDRLRNGSFGAGKGVLLEIQLDLLCFGFGDKVFGQMLDETRQQESTLWEKIICTFSDP